MDYFESSILKTKIVLFDQLSFWLILGVLVIFLAGTAFGRMTDANVTPDVANRIATHHHSVYGRFGSLHWLQ